MTENIKPILDLPHLEWDEYQQLLAADDLPEDFKGELRYFELAGCPTIIVPARLVDDTPDHSKNIEAICEYMGKLQNC